MIGLNSILVPVPDHLGSDLDRLFRLIAMVQNPNEAAAMFASLKDAAEKAERLIAEAKSIQAQIAKESAEHDAALKSKSEGHRRRLTDESNRFNAANAEITRNLDERTTALAALERKAETDAAKAATLKAELQRRLDLIKSAAA